MQRLWEWWLHAGAAPPQPLPLELIPAHPTYLHSEVRLTSSREHSPQACVLLLSTPDPDGCPESEVWGIQSPRTGVDGNWVGRASAQGSALCSSQRHPSISLPSRTLALGRHLNKPLHSGTWFRVCLAGNPVRTAHPWMLFSWGSGEAVLRTCCQKNSLCSPMRNINMETEFWRSRREYLHYFARQRGTIIS